MSASSCMYYVTVCGGLVGGGRERRRARWQGPSKKGNWGVDRVWARARRMRIGDCRNANGETDV